MEYEELIDFGLKFRMVYERNLQDTGVFFSFFLSFFFFFFFVRKDKQEFSTFQVSTPNKTLSFA